MNRSPARVQPILSIPAERQRIETITTQHGLLIELSEAPPVVEPDPRLEPGVGRQVRPLRGRGRLGGQDLGLLRGLGLALLPLADGRGPVPDEAGAGEKQEHQAVTLSTQYQLRRLCFPQPTAS
jgi:hypothetical protein